jgi:hypothetical protein
MVDELTAADDVISFEFDVTFDPTVIDITGASTDGTLSDGFTVVVNEVAAGQVRVAAAGTSEIAGEGTLINLVADLLQAGESDLTISNLVFNEGAPVLAAIAGRISISAAEVFEATLAGYNEVDPVDTDATGSVTASLQANVLVLTGSFSGLSAAYTASHIHQATAGTNGGVIIPLVPTVDGDGLGGTFEAASNTFALTDDQVTALRAGDLYVNVHTSANPGGEIRGQLLESPNAAPEAVDITSPTEGEVINIEEDPEATLDITWEASTDPDGDDVYYVLESATVADFSDGEAVFTTTDTGASITYGDLAAALIDEGLTAGDELTVYFRANAQDGSARAIGSTRSFTLVLGVFPQFMANLSGVNEVPPAMTVGSGTVLASLSGRTLVVSGSFSGLSGSFTASHIHVAAVGVSGPVVLPLDVTIGADGRSGTFDPDENTYDLDAVALQGGMTADTFIEALEEGNAYVNVHSAAYSGGEIRGQILSVDNVAPNASQITVPGDGVRIVIEGDPSSTGMAIGVNNASDPNGDRVAYIYQVASDAAFENVVFTEILLDPIGVELTVDDLADIYDSVVEQVVVGGEITLYHRVVTTDGSEWTAGAASTFVLERQSPTGTEDPEVPGDFSLLGNYPNPFNPSTTIRFDLPENAEVSISIFDALGREVMSTPAKAMSAGANRMMSFDAASIASGTYIYRVVAKGATSTMVDTGMMTLTK